MFVIFYLICRIVVGFLHHLLYESSLSPEDQAWKSLQETAGDGCYIRRKAGLALPR